MANSTDKSILTAAGKALLAQLNAEEKALVIDKMIFANVPNRPEYPQPDDVVPTDHIVHQEQVEQRGRLSADSVIYSTTLTSDVGPFDFNWTGAYCSEYGVLVTIDHHALTPKTADEPGVAGNTLVRSVVLEYKDIAEITNITVDASSWQYNATERMKKMDSDVAQSIIDQNGKDWFIEDGFLVTPSGSAYSIKAGAGYVSGNRVAMEFDRSVQVPNKPSFIYIDAHREGTTTGEQVTLFNFVVTAEEKDDYIDSSTGKDVKHFVCKIAEVLMDGSVVDLRSDGEQTSKTYVGDVAGYRWGDHIGREAIVDRVYVWQRKDESGNALGTPIQVYTRKHGVEITQEPDFSKFYTLNDTFSLDDVGISEGSDITDILANQVTNQAVKKIVGNDRYVMSKFVKVDRDNLKVKLNSITWLGDYDLYQGSAPTRQIGIITVSGSRDEVPINVTSDIVENDSTFRVDNSAGVIAGEFVVIRDDNKTMNYLARVLSVTANSITTDYTPAWQASAPNVRIYKAKPVSNVSVYIDEIKDLSGSVSPSNQISGVVYLDTVGGQVIIGNAQGMANPALLVRRAYKLKVPIVDAESPRYVDSGRGYTVQFNGALFCTAGILKGHKTRHVVDWTVSAYCTAEMINAVESSQIAVTTHGQYEHDITVGSIYTSKGSVGTLALANAGMSFGERTKRFKVKDSCIINGHFDIQNSEDTEINGARVVESDFVRVNADCVLNDGDFSLCTSFRVRSREDRDQKTVILNGGNYPDVEFQGFTGSFRALNSVMKWFANVDTAQLPKRLKTDNCRHLIETVSILETTDEVSISSSFITVPVNSNAGVIVESKKLSVNQATCENSPVISHDGSRSKVFIVTGLTDIDPSSTRTAAVIRTRDTDGLCANISGVVAEYQGSGPILQFGRNDVFNCKLVLDGNILAGDLEIKQFGSVTHSIVTGNMVKNLLDLPEADSKNAVANNIQI
ncbi:phage tail protein [Vibrio alginolyticus]